MVVVNLPSAECNEVHILIDLIKRDIVFVEVFDNLIVLLFGSTCVDDQVCADLSASTDERNRLRVCMTLLMEVVYSAVKVVSNDQLAVLSLLINQTIYDIDLMVEVVVFDMTRLSLIEARHVIAIVLTPVHRYTTQQKHHSPSVQEGGAVTPPAHKTMQLAYL